MPCTAERERVRRQSSQLRREELTNTNPSSKIRTKETSSLLTVAKFKVKKCIVRLWAGGDLETLFQKPRIEHPRMTSRRPLSILKRTLRSLKCLGRHPRRKKRSMKKGNHIKYSSVN